MAKGIYKNFGGLIKWPQCVITGKKISIDQAREVLAKTDGMFLYEYDGNEHEFNKQVYKLIDRPCIFDYDDSVGYFERTKKIEEFRKKNGLLLLNYLFNEHISSCYIGGTHGWCHPNGTIFFNENIGKYPNWREVHEDCKMLAHAFPFLDMKVYLFNQEWSITEDKGEYYTYPRECVGGFAIKNGKCRLLKKSEYLSPNDDMVIGHHSLNNYEEKEAEKKEIFGDKADLKIIAHTGELFFNIDEFIEYFKGYLT